MKIRERYKLNKLAKVGETCICPSCQTSFVKGNYQQAFCKSKRGTICKDKYWNTVIPTKRCNRTRISPASAEFMATHLEMRSVRSNRPQAWQIFGTWHDDDWCEADGGSGTGE